MDISPQLLNAARSAYRNFKKRKVRYEDAVKRRRKDTRSQKTCIYRNKSEIREEKKLEV